MSDFLANVGWAIGGISTIGLCFYYPVLILIVGAFIGLLLLLNPKKTPTV